MAVLVTGGAGYIGSHTVALLLDRGEDVIIVDNLQTGHEKAVLGGTFYKGDVRNKSFLDDVFRKHDIEAVIHFAASSLVGESMQKPLIYYENNVVAAHTLAMSMIEHDVKNIVFSSTAATYGEPEQVPIREDAATVPTSPYGDTKLTMEKLFRWCDEAHGLKSISLRYFNAAGANVAGVIGEDHDPESHLVPIVLEVALGQRDYVQIFGEDYATPDGTCVRDYIHVMDLADAHWLALERLRENGASAVYNLGNGNGFSVKEVIKSVRRVTGKLIKTVAASRRPGDPAVLIASSEKAKNELNWRPQYDDLDTIIASAWNWHQAHPNGYND